MRSSAVLAALSMAFVSHVAGQNAEPVTDNPVGVVYKATLPEEPFFKNAALDGNVKGFITAMAAEDGHGVRFKVKFENLPKEGGPFLYHLHVDPAPDGNCTKTLARLDPFERGEETPCDSSDTASCQVGDLSGKHGNIGTDPFELEYTDDFASTKEGIGAFFGNRSFVLHYANKTRLTCADFVRLEDAAPPPSNETYTLPPLTTPTPSKTMVTTPSATGTPSTTGVLELPSSTATGIPSTASSNMLSASFLVTGITLLLAFL